MNNELSRPMPYRLLLKKASFPIPLTEQKFHSVHMWYTKSEGNTPLDLTTEEGKYLCTIKKADVERLYSAKNTSKDGDVSYQYHCGYGELHGEGEDCTCASMYAGMPYHIMHKTLRKAGFDLVLDGMLDNQFKNCTQAMKDYIKKGIAETGYKYVPRSRESLIQQFCAIKQVHG